MIAYAYIRIALVFVLACLDAAHTQDYKAAP